MEFMSREIGRLSLISLRRILVMLPGLALSASASLCLWSQLHFIEQFSQKKYNIDVNSRARAAMRLKTECEKLKKTMSANTTAIPLNIGIHSPSNRYLDQYVFQDNTIRRGVP
jgi:hypothetical protein